MNKLPLKTTLVAICALLLSGCAAYVPSGYVRGGVVVAPEYYPRTYYYLPAPTPYYRPRPYYYQHRPHPQPYYR